MCCNSLKVSEKSKLQAEIAKKDEIIESQIKEIANKISSIAFLKNKIKEQQTEIEKLKNNNNKISNLKPKEPSKKGRKSQASIIFNKGYLDLKTDNDDTFKDKYISLKSQYDRLYKKYTEALNGNNTQI